MLTAEELLNRSARPVDQSTAYPQIVYVAASRPTSRRWFLGALAIAAGAIAYGVTSGEISVSQDIALSPPHITVVALPTQAPAWTLPTANVITAPVSAVAQPAATIQVIPQGQFHAAPTAVPPTAVIPTVAPETQ